MAKSSAVKTPAAEAMRRARRLRQQMRTAGEFRQKDFRARLPAVLAGLDEAALNAFYDHIAERVDAESIADPDQPTQLPLFDLEGEYKLGDGRRVAKRLASATHALQSLKIEEANAERVAAAYQRKKAQYDRLLPFWGDGLTKEQAALAYQKAHPDA